MGRLWFGLAQLAEEVRGVGGLAVEVGGCFEGLLLGRSSLGLRFGDVGGLFRLFVLSEVAPEVVLGAIFSCRWVVGLTGFFVYLRWWFLVVLLGRGHFFFLVLLVRLLMRLFQLGRFLFVDFFLGSLEESGLRWVGLSLGQ